jgi:lysophospholipase L1-like esterase
MKKSLWMLIVVCLLAVSLCLPAAYAVQIKVACIGDSITYGNGTSDPATKSYPAALQQVLGPNYVVNNYGVSGRTLLKKGDYPYWNEAAYTNSSNWLPDIVIIMLGTNDSKSQNWQYQSEFVANYEEMVNHYKNLSSHPVVYANTCPAVYNGGLAGITNPVVRDQVIPKIIQAATETGCPVIDVYNATTGMSWNIPDNVHPNDTGSKVVANTVYYGLNEIRVGLSSYFNQDGFSYDSNKADGNYDSGSPISCYSADLINVAPSFRNVQFQLGPVTNGSYNAIFGSGQTITLPQGIYSALWFLGSGTNGDRTGSFQVNYTDGTNTIASITQKDWCTGSTSGQNVVQTIAHRHCNGADQTVTNYVFAYSIVPAAGKTVASLLLPSNNNMHVLAITLVPYLGPTPVPANFVTGFESGNPQPTWSNSIDGSSSVTGYNPGINPECATRNETAHAGTTALMYSGTANGGTTNCYFKVFQVNIPITSSTVLDYWIFPQQDNGRYVGVDFHCTDGMTLRDSGAVDQNGFLVHPYFGHGGALTLNAWSEIKCNVGMYLAGKTVDKISVAYDRNNGSGQFRGYIDDISISN